MKTVVSIVMMALTIWCMAGCSKPAIEKAQPVAPAAAPAAPDSQAETPAPGPDMAALFEAACTTCHTEEKVTGYVDETPWQDVVKRMIDAHGAKIESKDVDSIVTFLNQKYPLKPTAAG